MENASRRRISFESKGFIVDAGSFATETQLTMSTGVAETSAMIDAICGELNGSWTGRLTVADGTISASLLRFDRKVPYRNHEEENVSLILETGDIATLLQCSPSSFGSRTTATTAINHHQFSAGYLLLGSREWLETDKVKVFEFCLPDAKASLSYREHRNFDLEEDGESLVQVSRIIPARYEIMRVSGNGYEVVISKAPTVRANRLEDVGDNPTWISVHYYEPCPLFDAFEIPYHIRTLFALSEGEPLRETGLAVQSADDAVADTLRDFSLYQSWRAADYQRSEHIGIEQILRVFTSEDRKITENVLSKWLARREQWRVTYWLASQFVQSGNVTDRGRLMKAMAWFESIPDYQIDTGLTEKALSQFRRESRNLESFKNLGIPPMRLTEALGSLRRLPLAERFLMAIRDLQEKFGKGVVSAEIEKDCELAVKLRNNAAHGSHSPVEEDFREVVIASAAVETVAFLATFRGLDVDNARIRNATNRFRPHPYASYQMWADSRPKLIS